MLRRTNLHINLVGGRDLSGQIERRIRRVILDGLLDAGQALPSTRQLATQLAVSRTTVGAAYDKLMAEGLVHGRAGVGTFVSARPEAEPARFPARSSPLRPASAWSIRPEPARSAPPAASGGLPGSSFDLRPGVPDPRLFPFATWRALLTRHTNARALLDRSGVGATGHLRLREALARHLSVFRSVRARPADVFVTNGAEQALELAAKVLLEPGDTMAVEAPGHRDVAALFASAGRQVVPIPVDDDGMVVDAIPAGVRCVHVRAARQFPLGMALSPGRRQALLDWAAQVDGVIIEDDYDGEYQYSGRPLGPLHSLDPNGRVVHVGSLARLLLPEVGVGYLVAPAPLHDALYQAKQVIDATPAGPVQLAVATFIEEGHLARQLRRTRSVYAERRRLLAAAARDVLGRYVTQLSSPAGLDIAVIFRDGNIDDALVARCASEFDVTVPAISDVATTDQYSGLLLGFGALPAEHIDESMTCLRKSIEAVTAPVPR